MRYIKAYEAFKPPGENDPKVGDYIVLRNAEDFILNKIGKIVNDLSSDMANFRTYKVEFDNTIYDVWDDEIEFHSKNREDVEVFLSTKKYNI